MALNPESIEITIKPNGETSVEVKGMSGTRCLQTTESIIKGLGTVKSQKLKAEYHDQLKVAEAVKVKT